MTVPARPLIRLPEPVISAPVLPDSISGRSWTWHGHRGGGFSTWVSNLREGRLVAFRNPRGGWAVGRVTRSSEVHLGESYLVTADVHQLTTPARFQRGHGGRLFLHHLES